MKRQRIRPFTRDILTELAQKINKNSKNGPGMGEISVVRIEMEHEQENLQSESDSTEYEDEEESYDDSEETEETEEEDEIFESENVEMNVRDSLWRFLSDVDLRRMHFLLTTTHSKAAVCLYFDIECIENEESMKKLLLGESHLKTIEACAVCAEDLEKCKCKKAPKKCKITFMNLHEKIQSFLRAYGQTIRETHVKVARGETTSSTLSFEIF